MFNFGKNWHNYSRNVSKKELGIIQQSLLELFNDRQIKEKSFLDIGCGSGLFSIAAKQLGAVRVAGLDVLKDSIKTSKKNLLRFLPNQAIDFYLMSILNNEQIKKLGKFDNVYAWGSLHHTGDMYKAIDNTCNTVQPGGYLILALYNKNFTAKFWWFVKWLYNHSPWVCKKILEIWYLGLVVPLKILILGKVIFQKKRGMKLYYDAIDWLGGFPYEYASVDEIKNFIEPKGFILERLIKPIGISGCNQFIFKKAT